MENHDALQIAFSVSSREQRRAGRRMCRYRSQELKRRYWLGVLVAIVLFALLYGGFFFDARRIAAFLQESCAFLPGEEVDVDDFSAQWDLWFANREAVVGALQRLLFWSVALLWAAIIFLRWNFSMTLRSLFDPPDGREFLLSISVEGLTMEESGRSRLFYFWPAVSRVILDKDFLFFYVNRNVAWFIPLDRFSDAAAAAAFSQQALAFKERS